MDALTTYYIRRAALEVAQYRPRLTVYIPEEPDADDVVKGQTLNLLKQCESHTFADQMMFDHEILINDMTDILWEVGKAYASFQRHEVIATSARAVLGARITDIVTMRLEQVARWQLEHNKL